MSQETRTRRKKVVMALFLHSRGFSIAILENALTVVNAYNVVLHSYPICDKKVLHKVKEKMSFYVPEVIILEDANGFGSRKGKRVAKLISKIQKQALTQKLKVKKYSRNDIRFVFNSFNAYSKYEIARVISNNIQHLPVSLPEKRKSHMPEHYSMTIFDAISLAVTHYYQSE